MIDSFGINQVGIHIEVGAIDEMVLRQVIRQDRGGVNHATALPEPVHLLKADDIGIRDLGRDTREIIVPIRSQPVLDIICRDPHGFRSLICFTAAG